MRLDCLQFTSEHINSIDVKVSKELTEGGTIAHVTISTIERDQS